MISRMMSLNDLDHYKVATNVDTSYISAKDRIYSVLKQDIFDCKLRPGDVLVIDDLCHKFSVSRTPIREALITLCNEGLLEVKQRFGFIVKPVNIKDIVETYKLRIILEKETVQLATRNMRQEDIEKLKALIHAPGTPSGRLFHTFLAASSGWGVLAEVLETLMDKSARARSLFNNFQRQATDNDFDSKQEHGKICEAIISKNEEKAACLMEKHLCWSCDYILKVVLKI